MRLRISTSSVAEFVDPAAQASKRIGHCSQGTPHFRPRPSTKTSPYIPCQTKAWTTWPVRKLFILAPRILHPQRSRRCRQETACQQRSAKSASPLPWSRVRVCLSCEEYPGAEISDMLCINPLMLVYSRPKVATLAISSRMIGIFLYRKSSKTKL